MRRRGDTGRRTPGRLLAGALCAGLLGVSCSGGDGGRGDDREPGAAEAPDGTSADGTRADSADGSAAAEDVGDDGAGGAYGDGWPAVHADGANTDHAPVEGPADVRLAWERRIEGSLTIGPLPWTINVGPTIDGDGRLYLTSTAPGCHLQAIDGATGETLWCSPELDVLAVVSSPLLDDEGRLFLADGEAMHALDRDGEVLWERPIVGVPLSAQFTPQGHVLFVTHLGVVHVLDRTDGTPLLDPVELAPVPPWAPEDGLMACARGTADCPSANTIAVDATGRFYLTFWAPGAPQAGLRALRYTEGPAPAVTPLWAVDALPGGSASSPVLSADGSRVYVTDNVDALHAVDTATGETAWRFRLGHATGGSPSLSPDGHILPAGGRDAPLLAVRDEGDHATLAWRHDDMANRGIATQAAGHRTYATVATEGRRNELVVLDTRDGTVLDREEIPGTSVFGVGTTVGPDGTVYVPTIVGGLHAYAAAPP